MTSTSLFSIIEREDGDNARRLTLTGELDIASAPELEQRLQELGSSGQPVRLDLSELDFMDSTGISTILRSLRDATRDGWRLEVGSEVPPQAERLITITGLGHQLWPTSAR